MDFYSPKPNEKCYMLPVKHCEHEYRVGIATSGWRVDTRETIATEIYWARCKYEKGKGNNVF